MLWASTNVRVTKSTGATPGMRRVLVSGIREPLGCPEKFGTAAMTHTINASVRTVMIPNAYRHSTSLARNAAAGTPTDRATVAPPIAIANALPR